MFCADIGDDSYCGLDDRLQACHFAHFGYACLKNGEFGLLVQLPYAERYAYLRVVGTWRAGDMVVIFEQLV